MESLLKTKRRLTRVFTGGRCQWLQDLDVFAAVTKQTWNIVPVSFNQVGVDQVGVDPKMRSRSLSDFIPTAQPFASGDVEDK